MTTNHFIEIKDFDTWKNNGIYDFKLRIIKKKQKNTILIETVTCKILTLTISIIK